MLSARRLISHLVIVALLVASTGTARAQELSGKWFKLKVASSGVSIDAANGDALKKNSFKTTAYLLLTFNVNVYDFSLRTETAPGVWQETDTFSLNPLLANESIGTNDDMFFDRQGGTFVHGFFTYRITIKRDKNGAFVSATLKSLGGSAIDNSTVDGAGNVYRGSLAIAGKTVDPSKLPFTP